MNEINSSRIKLSQLRALVAVAEYGNFSEAALHLELSQSAVSHAIASLEDELGVLLLSRGRHGAHLTPVGERVIDYARQVLQLLGAMVKEANLEKGLHGGSVRIACFRSVGTHVLPAVIAQFRRRFPEIAVTINEHSDYLGVEEALREGRADIGFTILPAGSEFEIWEILRDEFIVLLPPTAKLQTPKITWEQLAVYPLILPLTNACYAPIRKQLQALEFPLNVAYEVGEDSTMVGMVLQGLGATIMPRLAAEPLPAEVQVSSLPVPLERVIGVAVVANALQTPAVFAFLDTLKGADRFTDQAEV
jgi:DNA-binding transcriptional LysR family regulator